MKRFSIMVSLLLIMIISCTGDKKEDFKARLNYKNNKFRFAMTFPESWLNYSEFGMDEIIDPDLKVDVVYFALPTRSREWQPVNVPAGYAALFSIRIFTPEQWTLFLERYSSSSNELNLSDRRIGESEGMIYMVRNSRSIPVDLYLYMKDISHIVETFRVLRSR